MRKQMYWLITIALGLQILYSCSPKSTELEDVLHYSGNNRIELEKVLNHYKNIEPNPLKLEAAKYLILNMPKHLSYNETSKQYYSDVDSILNIEMNKDSIIKKIEKVSCAYDGKIEAIEDIKYVKSEYLIKNIEKSFDLWEKPWAKNLSFEEFCEYLLPYKLANYQSNDYWKDSLYSFCSESLNRMSVCQDYRCSAVAATSAVNNLLKEMKRTRDIVELNVFPILDSQLLLKLPFGSCYEYCFLAAMLMRSQGIPVAIDFTPQWPDRKSGHSWNVVLSSNRGKNVVFAGALSNPGEDHFPDAKMAKVFRHTFTANKELSKINSSSSFVPEVFRNIFIKDVTEEYIKTVDISVPLNKNVSLSGNYVYLCVFDNNNWQPVCWGITNKGIASFERVGKNIVYLPVACLGKKMQPVGSAFLLNEKGEVEPIKCDKSLVESIIIKRKFPLFKHVYAIKWRLVNGKIQAANKSDFQDSVTLAKLPEWELTSGNIIVNSTAKYRYFRFMSSSDWYCDMAELFFYGKDSHKEILSKSSFIQDKSSRVEYSATNPIEDRDLLTFFSAFKDSVWIGFDFGTPVEVSKISYIRRGDGNAICPGQTYELYYWDDYKWVLIGKQKALNVDLSFNNVPQKSLLYIRNSSKGIDNRIFLYRNNEMVWY